MDKPGRVLRGRPKTSEMPESVATQTRRGTAKTAIPVSSTTTAAGNRRSVNSASESGAAKKVSKGENISPTQRRTSPLRRSSRPRSTIPTLQVAPNTKSYKLQTTKEEQEVEEVVEKPGDQNHFANTLTTNTSSKAPNRITTTSSTHSSYSSFTQKIVETRTTSKEPLDINRITDFIRRSVSKTKTRGDDSGQREGSATPSQKTDGESRYSRSTSRSLARSVYDGRYSRAEFSETETNDQDAVIYEEDGVVEGLIAKDSKSATSLCRKLPVPKEFGGWWGCLFLMLSVPFVVYYLHWCCSQSGESCQFKMPNYNDILDINDWGSKLFNIEAVGTFMAFNMGIFVLSAVLFGRGVRLPGCVEYKFNALPITIGVTAAYAAAEYFQYPVADFIISNYHRFAVYGLWNAYVMALWAYVRGDVLKQTEAQCNVYAKSGTFVVDYALGRYLNPKWIDLVDYKLVFYRLSIISVFLHSVSLLYKNIQTPYLPKDIEGTDMIIFFFQNMKYDTPALICALMTLAYILDSIVFEHHLASSFELQREGFGCLLLLRYAATPILLTSVAKYFYDNRTPVICMFSIYVPLVLLAIGLVLKRFANAIKYKYRVQPNHPHFNNYETIHTFQGRRLLLGSLWGRLRQPNYLGDIICLMALALPLAMRFAWPPLISILLIVVVLVHRCFRVNDRNSARYHSSWVRYRSIARNYLIPKVF